MADPLQKKRKTDVDDSTIQNFIEWMEKRNFVISPKVKITGESVNKYGLIAIEDIQEGEELFQVPRSALLWEETSCIAQALNSDNILRSQSGWVKLILALMFEYTNKSSLFRSYLDFAPSTKCMDQPMFWNDNTRQLLKGTGVLAAVSSDVTMIEKEYHDIALPFIKRNAQLGFDNNIHGLELYKHMVAFVMAYSFTEYTDEKEDATPFMVPLADVLNHIAKHNAELVYEKTCLKMTSIQPIESGTEIYNTYGHLANWQLLQMYGFVEEHPCNIYDTVDLSFKMFANALKENMITQYSKKISWLTSEGGLEENTPIAVGMNGVLSCQEFKLICRLVPMSGEEFKAYCSNLDSDDWESDSSENSDNESEFEMYSFQKISKMPQKTKLVLKGVVACKLNEFKDDLITDCSTKIDEWRCSRANILVRSQKEILKKLSSAIIK